MLSLSFVATEAVTDTVSRALKLFSKAVCDLLYRACFKYFNPSLEWL